MKKRVLAISALFAIVMACFSAAAVTQRASAACYDQNKQPVPCPQQPNEKKKKPTPTDQPTTVPTPTVTTTREASAPVTVLVTPDASQLALLCASLPAAVGGNGLPNAGGSGPAAPGSDAGVTIAVTPPNTSGFSGFELGGGGLLVGILIGLLLPAILKGGLAPPPPGIIGPVDDKFAKISDLGNEKIDGGSFAKQGAAGMDDWERGGGFDKRGEAGMQDFHQKVSGFQKQTDAGNVKLDGGNFDKDAKASYPKQDGAGMGDGSVHNMDNQFAKGMDAGPGGGPNISGVNGDG